MKKILCFILILSMLYVPVYAATIDNEPIDSCMFDGVTYAPLNQIAKALELELVFEEGVAKLYANNLKLGLMLTITEGAKELLAQINDVGNKVREHENVVLPSPVKCIDAVMYVPLRAVCEAYGARVYWDEVRGAYVQRSNYNRPTLIRTKDDVRQIINIPEYFNDARVLGDDIFYRTSSGVYCMSAEEKPEKLTPAGDWAFSDDKLFVLTQQNDLFIMDTNEKKAKLLAENVVQFMVLSDERVLCASEDKTVIKTIDGELLYTLSDDVYYFLGLVDGRFCYIDKQRNIKISDSVDEINNDPLTSTVYYATVVDGYIYYQGDTTSLRRINIKTEQNELVFGLPLELAGEYNEKYLFNYFAQDNSDNLFIANPDGTEFLPFSDVAMTLKKAVKCDNGIYVLSYTGNSLYYIENGKATKVTDDVVSRLCGEHDGYVYYTVS